MRPGDGPAPSAVKRPPAGLPAAVPGSGRGRVHVAAGVLQQLPQDRRPITERRLRRLGPQRPQTAQQLTGVGPGTGLATALRHLPVLPRSAADDDAVPAAVQRVALGKDCGGEEERSEGISRVWVRIGAE